MYKSEIFNLGYNNENYKKIDIAKTVQQNFFKDINIDIVEKDLDLRSYRLNFDKMKKYFDLSPASNLLRVRNYIKNIKNNYYGILTQKNTITFR